MTCVRWTAGARPCCCAMAITQYDFARGRADPLANVFALQMSRRNRRLIETAAIPFPSVVVEHGNILPCRDGRPSF